MTNQRNPLIIPGKEVKKGGCPHCHAYDFSGSMANGVLLSVCRKCGGKWAGGLPRVAQDPMVPLPPESYVPPVRFEPSPKKDGEPVEVRRRVDTTPAYRKGLPIPEGEE
jgi:hypothetical protein